MDAQYDVIVGPEHFDRVDFLGGVVSGNEARDNFVWAVADQAGLDALPDHCGRESGGHRFGVLAAQGVEPGQ